MVADAFDSASARRGRRTRSTTRSTTVRDCAREAREGVLTSRNLAEDSPASSTTCVLRVKFEASSVRGVTVSRDVSGGGANVAVVARRDASPTVKSAEVLAWQRRPARLARDASRIGSFSAQRDGDDAEIRTDAIVASPTSAAALFRARAGSSPSRPTVAFDAVDALASPNGKWLAIPRRIFQTRRPSTACACVAWRRPNTLVRGAPAGRHRVGDERRGCRGCRGAEAGPRRRGRFAVNGNLANVVADGRRVFRQVALASSIERATRSERDPKTSRRARVFVPGDARGGVALDGSWLVGFGAEGSRARAWRGDEPAWTGVSQGTRAETPRNDDSDDSTPNPAFSRATRRGVAIPSAGTFSEERFSRPAATRRTRVFLPRGRRARRRLRRRHARHVACSRRPARTHVDAPKGDVRRRQGRPRARRRRRRRRRKKIRFTRGATDARGGR